jgi:UDP-N-acetylglucosamine 2-epimerase (non-hydrolysing)
MKLFSVIGTRPNFIKEFVMNREFRRRGTTEIMIHTGQHYDYEMSQIFFDGFQLPKPDHYLDIQNLTNAQFTAETILKLDALLRADRPDFVLSYGDVNSTLAAAVAATKNRLPFAHVEGGVRGNDLYNPEEINRRVADVLAEAIYCCTKTDVAYLVKENYDQRRIVLSGDLMNDALAYTVDHHNIGLHRGDYLVLTLHRQENVVNADRLASILDGLIRSERRILFPAHPRTLQAIKSNGLLKRFAS